MLRAFLKENPLYRHSLMFGIGTLVAGFGNYLYQLFMGRMLSLGSFGTLASLLNLFAILNVPATALMLATTKYVTVLKVRTSKSDAHAFVMHVSKFVLVAAAGFTVLLLLGAPVLGRYMRLDSLVPYYFVVLATPCTLLISLWRGVFPAFLRFQALSLNQIFEGVMRVFLGVLLVMFAFGLNGAAAALFGTSILTLILIFRQLGRTPRGELRPTLLPEFLRSLFWIGILTLASMMLQNIDTILVKRFFSPEVTGMYAAMALLGKLIFFASLAVASVLFPMSIELYETGDHRGHRRLLLKSLALIGSLSVSAVIFYWLFPNFVVTLFVGTRYLPFAHYLPLFGIIAGLLSIVQLLTMYFISIRRTWFIGWLIMSSLAEWLLLYMFHQGVMQILTVLVSIFAGLLAILLGRFFLEKRPPPPVMA